MEGPKVGELWQVGAMEPMLFVGVAREFTGKQWFIFGDAVDGWFVLEKDQFYSEGFPKQRIK